MESFFTGDTHFFHRSIIEYSERPFRHVLHMKDELIRRWNEVVTPEDIVYHLGDWALGCSAEDLISVIEQLNGRIITVLGNHDERTIARWPQNFHGLLEIELGILEKKVQS